jgi:hypothetical protein
MFFISQQLNEVGIPIVQMKGLRSRNGPNIMPPAEWKSWFMFPVVWLLTRESKHPWSMVEAHSGREIPDNLLGPLTSHSFIHDRQEWWQWRAFILSLTGSSLPPCCTALLRHVSGRKFEVSLPHNVKLPGRKGKPVLTMHLVFHLISTNTLKDVKRKV